MTRKDLWFEIKWSGGFILFVAFLCLMVYGIYKQAESNRKYTRSFMQTECYKMPDYEKNRSARCIKCHGNNNGSGFGQGLMVGLLFF